MIFYFQPKEMATELLATEDPGNTNPGSSNFDFKARAYLFTLNQPEKFPALNFILSQLKSCDYYVAAKELAPTTGHEHIHCYAHFKTPYKLNKKILSLNMHIDITRGSPKQCVDYVKKDGNILIESGTIPHQGSPSVRELKEMKSPDELDWRMFNTWQKIHASDELDVDDWGKKVEVYYISGESGAGKTERAKQIIREKKSEYGTKFSLVKYQDPFWNGVSNDGIIAVYDDFRDSHMRASEFVNFIDYNKQRMNIKGGSVINSYKLIIITSVQPLNTIYSMLPAEPKKQWMRRVIEIKV